MEGGSWMEITPKESKKPKIEKQSLKGTFVSVLLLGAFIVISWFAVFGLFISRG